jgi:hypothetical protein
VCQGQLPFGFAAIEADEWAIAWATMKAIIPVKWTTLFDPAYLYFMNYAVYPL